MHDTPHGTATATGSGDELRAHGEPFVCQPDWIDDQFSPVESKVWRIIARHADRRTHRAWPGLERIAELVGVSESTAKRAIAALVKGGALVVERRPQRTNVYTLLSIPPARIDARDQVTSDLTATGCASSPVTPEPEPGRKEQLFPNPAVAGSRESSTQTSCARAHEPGEVLRLCDVLAQLVKANGGRPRITPRTWIGPMRRLVEDGCPPEEVERVIRWARSDRFWRGVVVNGEQLRRHYDRLLEKANQAQASSPEAVIARAQEAQARGETLLPPGVQAMLDKRAAARHG